MLQDIIAYISTLDPALVYLVLFSFSFIENIFPPSPSDFIVVFGATLISKQTVSFVPILLITTIGSTVGFVVMFYVGELLGDKVLRKGRFKFIKKESLEKADRWFHKYGYKIILINRFMPGTRAVVSFFSGVHRLKKTETFFFAFISSLFWNALLICLGIFLGNHLDLIDHYLKTYSNIIFVLMAILAVILLVRFWMNRKKSK